MQVTNYIYLTMPFCRNIAALTNCTVIRRQIDLWRIFWSSCADIFSDLSLHLTVCGTNATRAEQSSPIAYASIRKNQIKEKGSCRPANVNRLRRCFPVTRLTMFWFYHVIIKQTFCRCSELLHAVGIYTFFRRQFGCAPLRLRIMPSTICLYTHTCACPNKAAQMYFGSMK